MCERTSKPSDPIPRVVCATRTGVLLDDRGVSIDDVGELAEALLGHRRGRLEQLRNAAEEVEQRIRDRVERSGKQIAAALEKTDAFVRERVSATTKRSREILEERYREGHERGRRDGFESGYSEGLQSGLEDGNRRGVEEGRRQARETFVDETSAARDAILVLAEELEERWRETVEAAHREFATLARRIAEQVILREVQLMPKGIEQKLHEGIDRIAEGSRIKIEIHPMDLQVVRRYLDGLEPAIAANGAIDIAADSGMARGGCRISSDLTSIDLSNETQLDILERRLLEARGAGS